MEEININSRVRIQDSTDLGTVERIEGSNLYIRWDDDKDRLIYTPITHFIEVGMNLVEE